MRMPVPGTFVSVAVGTQLNGSVTGFGLRLFGQIAKKAPILMARLNETTPLKALEYSDRYLRSPLSVRLLAEVLRHLASLPGGLGQQTNVRIRSTHDGRNSGPSYGLTGNWSTADSQRQVIELVLNEIIKHPPIVEVGQTKAIAHFRFLRLTWADDRVSEIRFDQGLSGMQVTGRAAPFDTSRPPARQATDLLRIAVHVEPVPPGVAPIYVLQA